MTFVKRLILCLSMSVLACLLSLGSASAQSLLITDCQGFTRALRSVKSNSLNKVEINVSDVAGNPAENVNVTLTNAATGETTTVASHAGIATFEQVGPGAFTLSTPATGISFAAVTIAPATLSTVAAVGVIGGASAVGGGAAAGAVVGVSKGVDVVAGNNNSPDPTPTPTPIPDTPTPAPTLPPTPTPCFCDPEAKPTPIETFFAQQAHLTPQPLSGFQ